MISAFIAAISSATKVILSKKILSIDRVPFIPFLGVETTFAFYLMVPLFFVFGDINFHEANYSHLFAFLIIIAIAFLYNYLYFYGLKNGKLSDVQPIAMTAPFFVMILTILIYPEERNWLLFVPAIVASLAIVVSRIEKKHLNFRRPALSMLGFSVLFAIETVLAKHVLEVFNSVSFYTLRIGILSFMFLFILRPNLHNFKEKYSIKTLAISVFLIIELVFYYMAISQLGLIMTSLIFLLAPIIIIAASRILLKERINLKTVLADVIVLCCIAITLII